MLPASEPMGNQSHKATHFLQFGLKILVVVVAVLFIVYKITGDEQLSFPAFIRTLEANRVFSLSNIGILVSLTLLNWFFEIKKWQSLSSLIRKNSLKRTTKESLASFTAAIFTPGRLGEYGAKSLFYRKPDRKKVLFLNFLGNFTQLFITVVFGIIGLLYMVVESRLTLTYFNVLWLTALVVTPFISYFVIRKKQWKIQGYSFKYLERTVRALPKALKRRTLAYATCRYLIFTHQFYYFLLVFNLELSYWLLISAVAAMFLLSSIIPTIMIFDAVIKGGFGVWIFSLLGVNEMVVLVVVLAVWILNFGTPALLGSYFVLKFKPPGKAVA